MRSYIREKRPDAIRSFIEAGGVSEKNMHIMQKTREQPKNMISRDITIKNSVGLHTRPATFFIQKANSYKSSIWIQKDDRRISAKSLLGVLSMGISAGTTITVIADGPDEVDAINGLEEFVESLV